MKSLYPYHVSLTHVVNQAFKSDAERREEYFCVFLAVWRHKPVVKLKCRKPTVQSRGNGTLLHMTHMNISISLSFSITMCLCEVSPRCFPFTEYTQVLSTSKDLKTSACTASGRPAPYVTEVIKMVPKEINGKSMNIILSKTKPENITSDQSSELMPN